MKTVLAVLLVGGPIVVYFAVYGLALLATRPAPVTPAPATEDLGPELPAVASVCANQWEVTEDAAESTLLDLGARRILEFRQPANDPMQTTVHVVQQSPTGLTPYEQRVFDRVKGLAVGGVVPLTALTFRDQKEAQAWSKRVASEVMSEVVDRGLARRRFNKGLVTALVILAIGCAVVATIGAASFIDLRSHNNGSRAKGALGLGFVLVLILAGFAVKDHGYRETPAGTEVAARWLGVRAWLRGHEAFGDLPPAAVAVWDRYIGYGAAVGASRVASAVIDLGMGNRKRAWSSFGGAWHRVRVHYPRFWPRYGLGAGHLIWRGTWRTALGFGLIIFWYRVIDKATNTVAPAVTETHRVNGKNVSTVVPGNATIHDAAGWIKFGGLTLGFALAAFGVYVLVRALIDTTTLTITGEVVWTEVWRSSSSSNSSSSHPTLYYLAVDNGTGDSTKAWAARPSMCNRCTPGDTVTIKVHRWSRTVIDLTVDTEGGESKLRKSLMPTTPAFAGIGGNPMRDATPLVSAEEASRVVGFPLTARAMALPGPFDAQITEYLGPDGKSAMQVMRGGGMMTRIAMRRQQRHGQQGQPVGGLGDEAYGGPGVLAARVGDQSFAVHVTGQAAATPPANLYALMQSLIRNAGQPPATGRPADQPAPAQAAMPGVPGMPNIPGMPAVLGAVVMADQATTPPAQGQSPMPPPAPMAPQPPATGRASVPAPPPPVPEQPPANPYQG